MRGATALLAIVLVCALLLVAGWSWIDGGRGATQPVSTSALHPHDPDADDADANESHDPTRRVRIVPVAEAADDEPIEEEETQDDASTWEESLDLRVVADDDGAPVAGAEVRILVAYAAERYRDGVTDAEGRITLPVCDSYPTVWVRKRGFQLFTQGSRDGFGANFDVRLKRGIALDGRVVDTRDGSPIAEAEVFVWNTATETELDVDPLRYDDRNGDGRVTDAEGRFEIAGVAAGTSLTAAARAEGRGLSVQRFAPGSVGGELTIRLGEGGVIEGRVTVAGSGPPAGVTVYAVPAGNAHAVRHPDSKWLANGAVRMAAFSRTDAQGRYRIHGLAVPGRYVALAETDAYAMGAGLPAALLRDGETAVRDIELVSACWPKVVAVAPDGAPVAIQNCALLTLDGAEIDYPFFSGSASHASGSNRYSLHTRPPGSWLLVVTPTGPWQTARVRVELREGESPDLDVTMQTGLTVRGVVVDETGTPVKYVRVVQGPKRGRRSATSTVDGEFEIGGLPDGPVTLSFSTYYDRCAPRDVTLDLPAATPLRVVLQRRPDITGVLHGDSGERLSFLAFVRTAEWELRVYPEWDDDGRFRLPGPAPGVPFDLRLQIRDRQTPLLRRGLRTSVGAALDLGALMLPEERPATGRLVDESGAPIASAKIDYDGAWGTARAESDSSGHFTVEGMGDEAVRVTVRAMHRATVLAVVRPGELTEIRCPTGSRVVGRLNGVAGSKTAGVDIRLAPRDSDGPTTDLRTDSLGGFDVRLLPGTYDAHTFVRGRPFSQGNGRRTFDRLREHLGSITVPVEVGVVVLRLPAR